MDDTLWRLRMFEIQGVRDIRLLHLYHVELRSQLCERSSSIVSFIKELENIKK